MLVWGLGSLEPGVLVEDQQPCPETVLSRHDDRPQVPTRPRPRRNLFMGSPRAVPSWGGAEISYFFQNREKSRPSSEQGEGQPQGERPAGVQWGPRRGLVLPCDMILTSHASSSSETARSAQTTLLLLLAELTMSGENRQPRQAPSRKPSGQALPRSPCRQDLETAQWPPEEERGGGCLCDAQGDGVARV